MAAVNKKQKAPGDSLCSFSSCQEKIIECTKERVEICASMPENVQQNLKSRFKVNWCPKGEAVFHKECWDVVLKSARARNIKLAPFEMIDTEKVMVKKAATTAERHDSEETLLQQAKKIANLIKRSSHCVAFTGAGISTSAGIGDYRGKSGKWTEMDRAETNIAAWAEREAAGTTNVNSENDNEPPSKKHKAENDGTADSDVEDDDGVPYEKLRPTFTHEALCKLVELGLVKHIISQNGDGLHGLSGVKQETLSELHGNVFQEKCEKCGTRYDRSFYVMDDTGSQYYEELEDLGKTDIKKPKHAAQCQQCGLSHRTGRKCNQPGCKGFLMDTIINFRDSLEEEILDKATDEATKSDLMLCLGSTITVTPACELVEMGQEPLRIVICNRQKTQLDSLCSNKSGPKGKVLGSRVFGDCDKLMEAVMKHIMKPREFLEWCQGREERLKIYDSKRQEEA